MAARPPKEYYAWRDMRRRCLSPICKDYKYYGGRGITVCAHWIDSFDRFLNDVGFAPSKDHTIDRINNDGNYEPSNVRWATKSEQNRNKRQRHGKVENVVSRTKRMVRNDVNLICYNFECRSIGDWAKLLGFNPNTAAARLRRGFSIQQAFSRQHFRFKFNRTPNR